MPSTTDENDAYDVTKILPTTSDISNASHTVTATISSVITTTPTKASEKKNVTTTPATAASTTTVVVAPTEPGNKF